MHRTAIAFRPQPTAERPPAHRETFVDSVEVLFAIRLRRFVGQLPSRWTPRDVARLTA